MTKAIVISIDGLAGFYWEDPRARMPHLRRLAERGVVASRMEAVFPSTTWPTHVSLVTGVRPERHGVAGNHILNRQTGRVEDLTGDPIHDASALLRVPTICDRAHDAGLKTAAVDWPATRHATALDWNLPFFKDQRVFESQTAPDVWAELGALGFPMDRQGEWTRSATSSATPPAAITATRNAAARRPLIQPRLEPVTVCTVQASIAMSWVAEARQ